MSSELNGKRIAFLVAQEGVEEVELTKPWEAVERAGGVPELIAPESGGVQAFNHLDKGSTFTVDKTLAEARAGDYDGVMLPGGDWIDQEVVVDQGLVSSRKPDDLPGFCLKLLEEFAEGAHSVAPAGARAHSS